MQRDCGRVWQVERRPIDRGRDSVGGGPAGHGGDGRRLRLAQQHARRQGLHPRIDLHHPGRHGLVLLDHFPAPGRPLASQLHPVAHPARLQLLTHLRRPADQDQPDRPHPGRQQEAHLHA